MLLSLGIEIELGLGRECCNGTGRRPCRCRREGRAPTEICPTCMGSGRTPCPRCRGTGEYFCIWCSGTHRCSCVNGTVTCDQCSGRGSRQCPHCGGLGWEACPCGDPRNREFRPDWVQRAHMEHCGLEFKGLLFSGLPYEEAVAKAIEMAEKVAAFAAKREIPDNAGLHVHVGAENNEGFELNEERVQRIVWAWDVLGETIYHEIAQPRLDRRHYCQLNDEDYPDNWDDFVYRFDEGDEEYGERHYCYSGRYFALNAWHSWYLRKTVEFRLWNSSDDQSYVTRALVVPLTVVATALTSGTNTDQTILRRFIELTPDHPALTIVRDRMEQRLTLVA